MVGERNAIAIPDGSPNKNGQLDTVINLGRSVSINGELSISDINRLNRTRDLVRSGIARRVIASGGGPASLINPAYAEATKGKVHLINEGLSPDIIHAETLSRHTWENAIFARKMIEGTLKEHDLQILGVLSSWWHDRTETIFDHVFGDDYKIHFIGVNDPPSPQDLQAEVSGRAIMHQIINNTPRGNLEAIEHYVSLVLPQPGDISMPLAA